MPFGRLRVDPSSFRIKVEPGRWQPAEAKAIGKQDWTHVFHVLPEGKMEQEGKSAWVTVTVAEGKEDRDALPD